MLAQNQSLLQGLWQSPQNEISSHNESWHHPSLLQVQSVELLVGFSHLLTSQIPFPIREPQSAEQLVTFSDPLQIPSPQVGAGGGVKQTEQNAPQTCPQLQPTLPSESHVSPLSTVPLPQLLPGGIV
jgi:hypothetical protein